MAESYLQLEAQRANLRLQLRTLNEDYRDLKERHNRLQESLGWAVQVIDSVCPCPTDEDREQFTKACNLLYMEEVLDDEIYG